MRGSMRKYIGRAGVWMIECGSSPDSRTIVGRQSSGLGCLCSEFSCCCSELIYLVWVKQHSALLEPGGLWGVVGYARFRV